MIWLMTDFNTSEKYPVTHHSNLRIQIIYVFLSSLKQFFVICKNYTF